MRQTGYLTIIGVILLVAILAGIGASRMSEQKRRHDFPDAHWVYLGTGGAVKSDGTRFHYDSTSIEASGNNRTFWLRGERAKSEEFSFSLVAWHLSANCTNNTFAVLETLVSDEYGRYIEANSNIGNRPLSAPPQTNLRAAQQAVCHRGR